MKPQNVDFVILVDASESMKPCFGQLREHLSDLLYPLQQANFNIRFGLVAYAAAPSHGGPIYDHTFVGGSGPGMLRKLYSSLPSPSDFFTSDPSVISRALASLEAQGNEDTLLALDIASDFPFGPAETTRRVVAVFTDETLENGVGEVAPLAKIPELIQKLTTRRIQLFVSAPLSPALEEIGSVDRAEIEPVDGGDGLKAVNFKKLLAQMGKSISISSLQMGPEPSWQRALYGQDKWTEGRAVTASNRRAVLAVGESVKLNASAPLKNIKVTLRWTAPVDLDLHAFYRTKGGEEASVYHGFRESHGIVLDHDAGIGDKGGQNEENLTIDSLAGFQDILFATKIFTKGGCYADYNGKVIVKTNNGDEIVVPLTSREQADWCVIAKLSNSHNGPELINLNKVTTKQPIVSAN
jgi:uncharacterized protein involved in tellurium resistance